MAGLPPNPVRLLFERASWPEVRRVGGILRTETVGGALLLTTATLAFVLANSPWAQTYQELAAWRIGPSSVHLDLTLAEWSADGLLAVFFFVAGLELKREFVTGQLRSVRRAALPVAGAIGGMALPALIYLGVNVASGAIGLSGGSLAGWAIPTATDIAFALAVLAVISTHLPAAMRTFLLALAVVDDLLAIVIIAVFYTESLDPIPLALALIPLGLFALLVNRRVRAWWILLPLAVLTWGLVHESGVHATVAGVALALVVPVRTRDGDPSPGLADRFEHGVRPVSAGIAVPAFAFFAAGVPIGEGISAAAQDPVTIGVVFGLVIGKCLGIFTATWAVQRVTRASLGGMSWWDVFGLALLAGIGFTVSLLIGELAFGPGTPQDQHARLGVLAGSLVSAVVAGVVLKARNRQYRRLCADEERGLGDEGPGVTETSKLSSPERIAPRRDDLRPGRIRPRSSR